MKVGGVIQYEPEVPYFEHCFSFKIYHSRGVPQSQDTALPRHQEEEEIDRTKHAQIENTYEKH